MICIRLLTAFAILFVTSAGAQDKPGAGDEPASRASDKNAVRKQKGQLGVDDEESERARLAKEKEGGGAGDAADGKAAADLGTAINHGARGFCRLDASVRPKRLLPGQTGTLLVTMVLEGDSVLTAPANVLVSFTGGTMTVGPAAVRPATRGTVAKAFLGQPVYDNFAIVEMPVTMPPTAALGTKQHAALDFGFELFQGATGRPLGQFTERVSVACEVGGVRDPAILAGPSSAANVGTPAAVGSASPAPATEPPAPVAQQAATDSVPKAAPIEAPVSSMLPRNEPVSDPVGDELPVESTSSTALWLGGIAAGIAVVLGILLRRR